MISPLAKSAELSGITRINADKKLRSHSRRPQCLSLILFDYRFYLDFVRLSFTKAFSANFRSQSADFAKGKIISVPPPKQTSRANIKKKIRVNPRLPPAMPKAAAIRVCVKS